MTIQETITPAAVQPLLSTADQTRTVTAKPTPQEAPKTRLEAIARVKAQPFRFPALAAQFEHIIGNNMRVQAAKERRARDERAAIESGSTSMRSKQQKIAMRRKQIRDLLSDWMRVADVEEMTGFGASTISKDIGEMKAAGRVEMMQDGRHFLYRKCTPPKDGKPVNVITRANSGGKRTGVRQHTKDRAAALVEFCADWTLGNDIRNHFRWSKGQWEIVCRYAVSQGKIEKRGANTATQWRATQTEERGPIKRTQQRAEHIASLCPDWRLVSEVRAEAGLTVRAWRVARDYAVEHGVLELRGSNKATQVRAV